MNGLPGGDRLRALRKARHRTLRTVAEAAGISEGYLSQIERGQANPSIATLQQIASALGLKVADLFGGDFASGPRVLRADEAPRLALGVLGGRKFRLTPGPQPAGPLPRGDGNRGGRGGAEAGTGARAEAGAGDQWRGGV